MLRRHHAETQSDSWQAEEDHLQALLVDAQTNIGVHAGVPLALKKNERVFQVLTGAVLIEPKRLPGQWQGRSKGMSFHIAKGVNYRIGATKGHYVQGDEVPSPIDTGSVTITDQRVVFQGAKATREWAFSKLLGIQHVGSHKSPWTAIQVSNRQKVSGFMYTPVFADQVHFRLDLALAHFNSEVDEVVRGLTERIEEHHRLRRGAASVAAITPQTIAPTSSSPPAWLPDPTARHQYRWWDGTKWTATVADNGQESTDSL